jgi:hypothetical protein
MMEILNPSGQWYQLGTANRYKAKERKKIDGEEEGRIRSYRRLNFWGLKSWRCLGACWSGVCWRARFQGEERGD